MMQRREFLQLATMSLLARCAESPAAMTSSDGFFHARPQTPVKPAGKTAQPQRLGIGIERDGLFYAPAAANAPLLLYLHGATGSATQAMPRLIADADRLGMIVVAPDSREYTWGMVSGDESADVAFIDRALDRIFAKYSVDPKRIGIAGFSDGASAALSWGLLNGDLFTGIAAFSPGFISLSSKPRGMPRIFISHGVNDQILPIDRCGRRLARGLQDAGFAVQYEEFDGDHTVPPDIRAKGLEWALSPLGPE
jgi:predicted esterase